jgi:hypothetical protein
LKKTVRCMTNTTRKNLVMQHCVNHRAFAIACPAHTEMSQLKTQ